MKRGVKSRLATRIIASAVIVCLATPLGAFAANPPPLSQVPVPEPPDLASYVKNKSAAIKLGKALFWDMQVGSDGKVACASCHYRAGADPIDVRSRNQLNPGPDTVFNVKTGPDSILTAADFPFHQVSPVDAKLGNGTTTRDSNDVVGSSGVFLSNFAGITPGSAVDVTTTVTDTLFQVGGNNVRQVTGMNTPPAVNAVFNYNNFWDGRAQNTFNGSSPIGGLDPDAGIWRDDGNGNLVKQQVAISNASLASQATGPGLSSVEMSAAGRSWPYVARKLFSLRPLASQYVHPNDSVLGSLSRATINPDGTLGGAKGLNANYSDLIESAFQDNLWNSAGTSNGFSQKEANFSLFWGLAVQLYEATLISDQTPFDRFLAGDSNAMSQAAQNGWNIFQSQCTKCHSGSELSNATYTSVAFVSNNDHNLIEVDATGVAGALSDVGFSNIGVRPSADNIGRGGTINFPLAFASLGQLFALGQLQFDTPRLLPGMNATDPVATQGAFKTPQLRNVELTAPYMHNGSMFTLDEVVEFYTRGGNFDNVQMDAEMSAVGPLKGNPGKRAEVVAFLKALTDERVRNDAAPFDHPELLLANGGTEATQTFITLPATGAGGVNAVLPTGTMVVNGGASVATSLSATLSLTAVATGGSVTQMQFTKDGGASYTPFEAFKANRTVTLLPGNGPKSIGVRFKDSNGNISALVSADLTLNAPLPSGSMVINAGAAETTSLAATLALSASSATGTVTHMQFSKDNGATFTNFEPYASTRNVTLFPGNGPKTVSVRFKDSNGNISDLVTGNVTLNAALPSGSVLINGGQSVTDSVFATLTLAASSASGTVTQMQFSKDGGATWASNFEPYAGTRVVTLLPGDGIKTMTVRYKDSLGNISAPVSSSITLAAPNPTGSIAFTTANPAHTATGVLALTASGPNQITHMQFSKNGSPFYGWEPFAATRTVTLLPGDNTLTVFFLDAAGKVSSPVSATITRN